MLPVNTCTVQDCAHLFEVTTGVVYTWIAQGIVPAQKIGPGHPWALTVNAGVREQCHQWIAQSSHLAPRVPVAPARRTDDSSENDSPG